MTSGNFAPFPVEEIFVNRDKRQRRELRNIDELAHSISRLGLINPVTIERTGELRAGERRWTAVKQLGWTHINVQFIDDLPPSELHLLELEENLRREGIEWPEECKAVLDYHELRSAEPNWSEAKTADALGMTAPWVNQRLAVAREYAKGTGRLQDVKKFSVARNIVARVQERAKAEALAVVSEVSESPKAVVPILNEDFNEWALVYTGQPFNLIHCDFPYGVNAGSSEQQSEQPKLLGGYEDSFSVYEQLLSTLKTVMLNGEVVAPSAHLIFWFSMDYYQFTFDVLQEMGWRVNPFPLVWHKSDNMGVLPDPQRGPRRTYETAFFASRGDRKLTANGAVANSFAHPGGDKSIHMSEKPQPVLRHFMRMLVDEYTSILDPTCGSANSILAARSLGAGRLLGLEIDPEFHRRAVDNFNGVESGQ